MSRGRWRIVTALVACLGVIGVISTFPVFNQTFDEPAHLAAGMEWLSRGVYLYEAQHPPLPRIAGAIVPYLAGARSLGNADFYDEGRAILGEGAHYRRMLFLARLGMLPFFGLLLAVCAIWGARVAGPPGAALATLFAATNPNLLAHAGIVGTDMAPAACVAAAMLAWMRWRELPSLRRALLFGVAMGLATVAKFSALVFLGPMLVLGEAARLLVPRQTSGTVDRAAIPWRHALLGVAATAVVVWAFYRFDVGTIWHHRIAVPAPELFRGVKPFLKHATEGHPAYLLGQRSDTGWWYYYLVALAVKTPLPLLALAVVGGVASVRAARGDEQWTALIPLIGVVAVLVVGMKSHVDLGIRLILSIYPFLAVLAARGVRLAWHTAGTPSSVVARRLAVALLLAATIVTPLRAWPDFLAYFNPVAGARPERILVDSNLDWGQDLYRLADTVRARRIDSVRVHYFGTANLRAVGLPNARHLARNERATGWIAASETFLAGIWSDTALAWLARRPPVARIGPAIRLYYIPPGEVSSSPHRLTAAPPPSPRAE
jgi:hypothetical protein